MEKRDKALIDQALQLLIDKGGVGLIDAAQVLYAVEMSAIAVAYFKDRASALLDEIEEPSDKLTFVGRYSKLLSHISI
jgi:hypothetical protein